jgi:hypothetical protein
MEPEKLYETLLHDLKSDLNDFLYSRVPETMTMKQFEDLSVKIHDMILESFECDDQEKKQDSLIK